MALDLQPIPDASTTQQTQVQSPQNTGNAGKLDLQPMLDLQPIQDNSNNDQSKITPFEQGMTKQLYNNVPFGKDIIKGTDAIAGTHMASDIESNQPPNSFGEKAGEFVGGGLSLFPAWEAGASLAGPLNATAKLAAGSLGIGTQEGQQALNRGAEAPEALGDAATSAAGTFAGGKLIEGAGNMISPLLRGVAGHGDVYRNLLNPGKGVVNDIEVKSGKDINDAFQTMADERLPIKSVVQNNRDTIDTNEARAQIRGKISGLYDQLQNKLQNSDAQFNLEDLKQQTLAKLRPIFKNDEDFEAAQKEVTGQFDAAIRQRVGVDADGKPVGDPVVDAPTLSNMKEGMWQKGYNLLAPNSQKVSRIIGNTLKQAIEDAHPEDTDIKDLNQKMGNLQTVDGILQKTHGKVVNGGALGNYLRGGVGAIVGEQIGALLGHPVIGTGVGGFVGEQANRLLNNPELVTSTLSKIRDLHEFGGNAADHISDLFKKFGPDNVKPPESPTDGSSAGIEPEVGTRPSSPLNSKNALPRNIPIDTEPTSSSSGPASGSTNKPVLKPPIGPDLGGNKGSVDISGNNAPTFYSQAAKTIDEKMPNAATPDQIRGILSPANGVKPDELKWMGMDDFLAGKTKISKADLQNFIKENQVQVQEVKKGGEDADSGKLKDNISDSLYGKPYDSLNITEQSEVMNAVQNEIDHSGEGNTKFSAYQMPGGKNYREMLLTLPEKSEGINYPKGWGDTGGGTKSTTNFRGSHFDEPNVLAHVRMNDRIDADGKKVLHIEEVQSDWHQKGRQQGYEEKYPVGVREDQNVWVVTRADGKFGDVGKDQAKTSQEAQAYADKHPEIYKFNNTKSGVPDAPFKNTWHELAMKRMIRYAAENGYDKLSWTTGAQQAERYDLSKQVDRITWRKLDDGNYYVAAHPKSINESATPITKTLAAKDIPDFVGKDAAQQILKEDYGTLRGQQLKVGGEGMKGFYDKMLPDFMNKYTKKWGGLVKDSELNRGADALRGSPRENFTNGKPIEFQGRWVIEGKDGQRWGSFPSKQSAIDAYAEEFGNFKVHSIDITPAMKQSVVKQGQPLFNWNPTTITGAAGLGLGAAMGAKKAAAGQPAQSDRLQLPPIEYTKKEEGFRSSFYKDTRGHKTIGYGFNVEDSAIRKMIPSDVLNGSRGLTTKEADTIFPKAYSKAQNDAVRFVGSRTWSNLSSGQKKALTDMSYNLGFNKLSGFNKMQIALQGSNWNNAAKEVLHSHYAKQVPNRAHRNAELIRNG